MKRLRSLTFSRRWLLESKVQDVYHLLLDVGDNKEMFTTLSIPLDATSRGRYTVGERITPEQNDHFREGTVRGR